MFPKHAIFKSTIDRHTSTGFEKARDNTGQMRIFSLAALGKTHTRSFLSDYKDRVASVTFLAGSGTRWIKSVRNAKEKKEATGVDIEAPRCLCPVPDVSVNEGSIPIGLYNLRAVSGIGRNVIVYRTHLEELKALAARAGIEDAIFVKQEGFKGSDTLMGHGEAMRQVLPALPDSVEFIITNFGGDPNSRDTIITSLLVLAAMQTTDIAPFALIPTALVEGPKYPITLDDNGFPKSFGHGKLMGSSTVGRSMAQTNIGVRVYLKDPLQRVVTEIFEKFFDPENGYFLNENSPEFGLDNVEQIMALAHPAAYKIDPTLSGRGKVRTLCIGSPVEAKGSVKTWEDIPAFLAAQKQLI